ncbi:MAG TPA: hypothetical protein VGJ13_04965 [Pseudonocardiaceae bacterium]|jgi:hypothetical protein
MNSLLHHVYDGRKETSAADYAAGWSETRCPDAPPISERMERALWSRLAGDDRSGRDLGTTWHHRDGNAWASVVDLHQAGEHDEATALARLLRWCDEQFTAHTSGVWEITKGEPR